MLEVNIVQVPVIDDVAAAEHGTEAFQKPAFAKLILVQALVAFEMIPVRQVILEPSIAPSLAGAVFEPERNDSFHQRQEERQLGHFL